mmetsp:Transcript_14129/g.30699  ORF Transcript_14129/g.30699 Transcript_14129/m.30699 type:complete len:350 (+) Transcript_14129:144-1193(+)|eukprot:CAMPEP_0172308372 /NCGR_PEP_ID=MMETSP1058-20130122/8983_1 /TAXON_ID=83371 /ORGANISM="Detonula confervacea, Strain CCMP 353" /LENGTH=349 /DNA_ID=CAMNT_0013020765 /DNA_START=146 /DNA_END=1195 /DNA_ORIENTATION=+
MSTTALQCNDCETKLVRGCFGLTKANQAACAECQKTLCVRCAGDQCLIPFQKNEEPLPLKKTSIKSYCRSCFKRVSILDYSKSYDIIEPPTPSVDPDKANITLLWVHGGGSSRAMFCRHASALAQKGYRSILMDLPGHGTLVDTTTLTLDSCVEAVKQILDQECTSNNSSRIIYVGGSLGAYTGFYVLEKLKNLFGGAVLLDCGVNVGPDCSLKARAGIWFLRKLSGSMNNKAIMGLMMGAIGKSKADYHLVECCYSGGMFFQQGPAQCDCMHAVAPADIIPTLDFPILFFNGSKDHRDSEAKWLALCSDKEQSSLKVYEGGDHFFCHDSRFVDDMLHRIDEFVQATGP